MASFSITTIKPAGYTHWQAFDEIRRLLFWSLSDLGYEVSIKDNAIDEGAINIIFGSHLLSDVEANMIPKNSIIFNTEQLLGGEQKWRQRVYSLSERLITWDYARSNIEMLNTRDDGKNDSQATHFRLGYHSCLERFEMVAVKDRKEFVFFGSMNPFRNEIMKELSERQRIRDDQLLVHVYCGIYGQVRDGILRKARACLNMHSNHRRQLEWPRIIHLIANRVPCISLVHEETIAEGNQLDCVIKCSEYKPFESLSQLYLEPYFLASKAERSYDLFRADEQKIITQEVLAQTYSSDFYPSLRSQVPKKSFSDVNQSDHCSVDSNWYLSNYPWVYSDPRGISLYHKAVGSFRQYHPSPAFMERFKRPVDLRPVDSGSQFAFRIAVVVHVFRVQEARFLFEYCLKYFAGIAELFITSSSSLLDSFCCLMAAEYGINIAESVVIENVGRDIPSKYICFNDSLRQYDLVYFTHGKFSDKQWLADANQCLAGSKERVLAILDMFRREDDLGLLFNDYLESNIPWIGWGSTRPLVDQMLSIYNCDSGSIDTIEFPAGGFYWARPSALEVINGLNLSINSLPAEPIPGCGTLLHAIERMPCISAEMMGYRWEKISRNRV